MDIPDSEYCPEYGERDGGVGCCVWGGCSSDDDGEDIVAVAEFGLLLDCAEVTGGCAVVLLDDPPKDMSTELDILRIRDFISELHDSFFVFSYKKISLKFFSNFKN